MIRVLHLLKTSQGAMWAVRQVRQLVKMGTEVHVALPPGGTRIQNFKDAGAITHLEHLDFPLLQPWTFSKTISKLTNLVQEIKPDLIHSHFVGTTLTMRLALRKHSQIPRVFQVPGPLHLENRFYRMTEIKTAGPNDYWIGACRLSRNLYLQSGVLPEKVYLSGYGVDQTRYDYVFPGKLRNKLQIPEQTKIVGMVALMYGPKLHLGQSRGLKGHEDFIDAVSICLNQGLDIVGVCVGGARTGAQKYEERLRARAEKKCGKNLIFLGTRPIDEVPALVRDFDIAVTPSLSENMGGAFEPMLMGIPVIATHVGGLPDIIFPNKSGWLVPPANPKAIASAITQAIKDPEYATKLAAKGQKIMRKVGNSQKNTERLLRIYKDILSKEPAYAKKPL